MEYSLSPVVPISRIANITNEPANTNAPAAESHSSGVSWAAVIGGAFVTAAFSLILLSLGTGLGLASVSPWANAGASASTIGAAAIVWLIMMQLIASAMGGYLAGRLRTKWASIHSDEVFFRDTAHGFLAWAVAVVITASFLASAAASMAGGAVQAGAAAATAGADAVVSGEAGQANDRNFDLSAYFVDMLFRPAGPNANGTEAPVRAETGRILVNALRQDDVPAADKAYLAQVVSARTGLSEADAGKRVSDVMAQARNADLQARQTVDTARKAAAHLSLWIFVALLTGAFCASFAATIGGRQRDHVVIV
jgi:hypothetical protein